MKTRAISVIIAIIAVWIIVPAVCGIGLLAASVRVLEMRYNLN